MRDVASITARASLRTQLPRFAVVGASNTALTWSLYALAVSIGVWYPLAAAGSFAAGAVNGYTLNRAWTFRAGRFSAPQLARYVIVQAGALGLNVVLLIALVELAGLSHLAAQLVALIAVAAVNFMASRHWAFAASPAEEALPRPLSLPRIEFPRELALRTLATVGALGVVAGCVTAVLIVASRASFLSFPSRAGFPDWLAGPFHGVLQVPERGWALAGLFSIVVAATMACYLLVVVLAPRVPVPVLIGAIVVLHAVFLLAPPFPLTDIFNYLGYARLGVLHHLNPFTHLPVEAKPDPVLRRATWHHLPTPYGPLFTFGTYALVPLGILKGYWALKALTVAASLGCLTLLWRCARVLDKPAVPVLAFVALNPLLLMYGLGGFHNDFFMMPLVLGAVLLSIRGRSALAGASAAAAMALKVAGGVFVPFVLLGARRRVVALAGAAGTGALLLAGAIAMFGTRDPGLVDQATKIVGPYSLPAELGRLFGHGLDATVRHAAGAVLLVAIVVLVVRTWRGADWIVSAGWAALALAATQVQPMPWYIVWALPFAALGRSRALRVATVVLGLVLLVNSTPTQNTLLTHTLHLHGVPPSASRATRALLH